MITILFCATAFILCLIAANRSLRYGILAVLAVGYIYGILRANFPDTWTYLTFDAAVLGLYIGQLWRPVAVRRPQVHNLGLWIVVLIAWPTLLFFVFPTDSVWVELVGLRANIFMLPFLLLGTRLDDDDLRWLALSLAAMNIAVVALGVVEFFVGIAPFYPRNEVTETIYRSNDLVGRTAFRIPGSFSSAHVFAGTLVTTLPLVIGAWVQSDRRLRWQTTLLGLAVTASLLGVFMAAARTHMLTAAALVVVVTFSRQLRAGQWIRWMVVVGVVAYVVAGDERLQRFTTLQDTTYVSERWSGSVNSNFFEAVRAYPLGNGLAGGGTSVPYFLRGNQSPLVMENEYARIGIEQGLPGLTLWLVFLAWIFFRRVGRGGDPWSLGHRLSWVACGACFFSGLTGIGVLSAVPQTVVMLLTMGWFVAAPRPPRLAAARTIPVRRPRPSTFAPAGASIEPGS